MPTIIIVGGQWGDEGKGKIVDYIASSVKPDFGVRFNGGANAGHSIENNYGKTVLHLIPSTVFTPSVLSVIASGVVIDPTELLKEINELNSLEVDTSNLRISDRAHLVMPWHKARDRAEERLRQKNGQRIGTTGRGIGPCNGDKVSREGLRVGDLFQTPAYLEQRVRWLHKLNEERLIGTEEELEPFTTVFGWLTWFREQISSFVVKSEKVLFEADQDGKLLLLEGAQGTLLDVEFGTYPKVTSSGTTRLGAYQGIGFVPQGETKVIGVFKGYVTRVGEGPFPTEELGPEGENMRFVGKEFGATTGRPRRCGWFDAILARYANQINGFTSLVLTKTDVMDQFETVKVCTGYRLGEEEFAYPPLVEDEFAECKPVYEEMTGWQTATNNCHKFEELPKPMQTYCQRIEELTGAKISLISVGPAREETIEINI